MAQHWLQNLRVVDFGRLISSAICTSHLAAFGMEVIKVESRQRIDTMRLEHPSAEGVRGIERCGMFHMHHRGHKSCTLNLSTSKGVELAKQLITQSDVVAENSPPRVMKKLGLDYAAASQLRPDIIYASITGWGTAGYMQDQPAYGDILQAFAGSTDLTGEPGGPPLQVGQPIIDTLSGMNAAFLVLAALYDRKRTGKGRRVEVTMAEVMFGHLPEAAMEYFMNGRNLPRMGNNDDPTASQGCYRCKGQDSWIAISIMNDDQWQALCRLMGAEDLANSTQFADGLARRQNQRALDELIGSWTSNFSSRELFHELQAAGIAAVPSFTQGEILEDPHLRERGFAATDDYPEIGPRALPNIRARLTETPTGVTSRAPTLGEHNDYVFGELLGLSASEIAALEQEQVIY